VIAFSSIPAFLTSTARALTAHFGTLPFADSFRDAEENGKVLAKIVAT
jgi:hypothetical protein